MLDFTKLARRTPLEHQADASRREVEAMAIDRAPTTRPQR